MRNLKGFGFDPVKCFWTPPCLRTELPQLGSTLSKTRKDFCHVNISLVWIRVKVSYRMQNALDAVLLSGCTSAVHTYCWVSVMQLWRKNCVTSVKQQPHLGITLNFPKFLQEFLESVSWKLPMSRFLLTKEQIVMLSPTSAVSLCSLERIRQQL